MEPVPSKRNLIDGCIFVCAVALIVWAAAIGIVVSVYWAWP